MSNGPKGALDSFWERLRPLIYAFPSLSIRSLSYNSPGGRFNIYTTILVSTAAPSERKKQEIQVGERFKILLVDGPSTELDGIIEALHSEVLVVGEDRIRIDTPRRLSNDKPPTPQPSQWHSWSESNRGELWDGRLSSEEAAPASRVETYGGRSDGFIPREEWNALNPALLGLSPPIHGTADLFKRILEARANFSTGHNCEFKIEVDWGCEFQAAQILTSGELEVLIRVPSRVRTDDLRIGVLLVGPRKDSWADEARLGHFREADIQGRALVPGVVPIAGARSVVVHILLRNQVVSRSPLDLPCPETPNPLFAALETVDGAHERLLGALSAPSSLYKNSDGWEVAVATILSLAGFLSLPLGLKAAHLGESADMIVMDPWSPAVYCVEATWKVAIDKGKLAKLARRASDLQAALLGYQVKGILVVDQESLTAPELTQARELGIIVLCLPQLRWIFRESKWNVGSTKIVHWLNGEQKLILNSDS
ncbi:MAG TPA: hypothetical protein VML94_08020 [Thermoplasmata archaeon]|nr:hypothetical protein [Thermoplasmata archaeon]